MAKSAPTDRKRAASDNGVLALAGAEILLKALEDEGVEVIFGYPGGAVYSLQMDILFQHTAIHGQSEFHAGSGCIQFPGGILYSDSGP